MCVLLSNPSSNFTFNMFLTSEVVSEIAFTITLLVVNSINFNNLWVYMFFYMNFWVYILILPFWRFHFTNQNEVHVQILINVGGLEIDNNILTIKDLCSVPPTTCVPLKSPEALITHKLIRALVKPYSLEFSRAHLRNHSLFQR